ncbi:MAG TPA: YggS family pyridoxal phosphate-dependent enzyme [Polyangiaceae bacterium]|nr:YggS family pyridoxal phosphate-dependent enzyme [Polyangiaceae bacterium]
MGQLAEQLEEVRAHVREASLAAGRSPDAVRLIAVSKGQPASALREAYAAGQRDFGENYAQELVAKSRELADLLDLRWHFIGHLQRNKVKDVVGAAAAVHTIDRLAVAEELSRRAPHDLDVLVEVNIEAEPQKAGALAVDVPALARAVDALPRLHLVGLMAIPPAGDAAEASRPHFAALARLAAELRADHPRLVELSMGMSQDYAVAIGEGATLVRVGTAIFGARAPKRTG